MATSMDAVKPASRATYGGVAQGLTSVGAAAGSLAAGLAYDASPMIPVYVTTGLMALGAVLLAVFLQETNGGASD